MEPMHARGFLVRLLNEGQRTVLREKENRLPQGRYFQAFEICSLYGLKPEPTDSMQETAMNQCWERFKMSPYMNNAEGPSMLEKIHKWEDWVLKDFKDVMPAAGGGWMQ